MCSLDLAMLFTSIGLLLLLLSKLPGMDEGEGSRYLWRTLLAALLAFVSVLAFQYTCF